MNENKILIFFGFSKLDDMLNKGNLPYVRHYEAYFDKVYVVYLMGTRKVDFVIGNTTFISLSKGKGIFYQILNFLLSSVRLLKLAKSVKATHYLTADLVFSWFTSLLIRPFLGAKIILMPVCMPEIIYKNTGRSLSRLPVWFEKLMIFLSFLSAHKILTGHSFGNFVKWLSKKRIARRKLIVVNKLVESLPSDDFFVTLSKEEGNKRYRREGYFILVYVGRLHREKLVCDLIKMMKSIKENYEGNKKIILNIIGDGPEKIGLAQMARSYGVDNMVNFIGYVKNEELPHHLLRADVFVSTLTGTALREAAVCGLPIVAYNLDWIVGLLEHEKNALLVTPGDFEGLAYQVMRLYKDSEFRKKLSESSKSLALSLWTPTNMRENLKEIFERV